MLALCQKCKYDWDGHCIKGLDRWRVEVAKDTPCEDYIQKGYADALAEFIKKHCTGREYDSCYNSPCRYASASGCQHPQHPKNR